MGRKHHAHENKELLDAYTGTTPSHASDHTDGTDDIQDATAGQKGLMSAADFSKLDGIEALADVTDATNVAAAGAFLNDVWQSEVEISGGDTLKLYFFPRQPIQLSEVFLWAFDAPASAAGTYTLAVADDSGNNILSAATFDLETMSDQTIATPTLTGTTADLQLTAAEWVVFTFTSNNADLTGEGLRVGVKYATN